MQASWEETLMQVRSEAERSLNETELKEYKTRIAILINELNEKNKQIE